MAKYEWEKEDVLTVKNSDLICKNCKFKGLSTATCIAYDEIKPKSVFAENECPMFKAKGGAK